MRKRAKKLLSMLLCGTMLCLYLPLQAQAVQFSDVSANAWYYTAISSLSDKGILSGTGGGKFSPYRNADPWSICHHAGKIHPVG